MYSKHVFSAFDPPSSEEQWAGNQGTVLRASSVHLLRDTNWILTLECVFLIVRETCANMGRACKLHTENVQLDALYAINLWYFYCLFCFFAVNLVRLYVFNVWSI